MAKQRFPLVPLLALALFLLPGISVAAIIPDDPANPDDGWKDRRAYRPNPILFLHGFASGEPKTWREPGVDEQLNAYFKSYFPLGPALTLTPPERLARHPYLELISFIDFAQLPRSQLIDRNSSVDTYRVGDYYVRRGERTAGDPLQGIPPSPGWSDKLNGAIQRLQAVYQDKHGRPLKVILVGHSMGGLAVMELRC